MTTGVLAEFTAADITNISTQPTLDSTAGAVRPHNCSAARLVARRNTGSGVYQVEGLQVCGMDASNNWYSLGFLGGGDVIDISDVLGFSADILDRLDGFSRLAVQFVSAGQATDFAFVPLNPLRKWAAAF